MRLLHSVSFRVPPCGPHSPSRRAARRGRRDPHPGTRARVDGCSDDRGEVRARHGQRWADQDRHARDVRNRASGYDRHPPAVARSRALRLERMLVIRRQGNESADRRGVHRSLRVARRERAQPLQHPDREPLERRAGVRGGNEVRHLVRRADDHDAGETEGERFDGPTNTAPSTTIITVEAIVATAVARAAAAP